MARLCERPGCSVPADASYGIDPEHLVVWLDHFGAPNTARAGVLCLRHADAMVVPLGWMLDDRREQAPRLFRTPDAADQPSPIAAPVQAGRRRRSRGHRHDGDDTLQLQLDADVVAAIATIPDEPEVALDAEIASEVAIESEIASEAEPTHASVDETVSSAALADLPWQPVFDHTDDLRGLLKTRGSLLSRAFHGVPRDDS